MEDMNGSIDKQNEIIKSLAGVDHQMVNMTLFDKELPEYMVDLGVKDGKIVITYADGHVVDSEPYTEHNYNVYRNRLEKQFYKYFEKFENLAGRESLMLYGKKIRNVLILLVSFYFLYNIDIHIITKVCLGIGVGVIGAFNYLLQHIKLCILSNELEKAYTLEYYLKNKKRFTYLDDDRNEQCVLNIEEIWKYNINQNILENIVKTLDEIENKTGGDIHSFSLDFKKNGKTIN